MTAPTNDRRRAPRYAVGRAPEGLTLRPTAGPVLNVIDLSPGGARVESSRALPPGAQLAVRPIAASRDAALMPAQVVYCRVATLAGPAGVTYQAGLCFEAGTCYSDAVRPHHAGHLLLGHRPRVANLTCGWYAP